jgi:hypothetical protein
MSDIQVQDPYATRPKFYKYESEDRQLLVDLLHEYSDKLISVARELEIKSQQVGSNARLNELIEIIFVRYWFPANSNVLYTARSSYFQ